MSWWVTHITNNNYKKICKYGFSSVKSSDNRLFQSSLKSYSNEIPGSQFNYTFDQSLINLWLFLSPCHYYPHTISLHVYTFSKSLILAAVNFFFFSSSCLLRRLRNSFPSSFPHLHSPSPAVNLFRLITICPVIPDFQSPSTCLLDSPRKTITIFSANVIMVIAVEISQPFILSVLVYLPTCLLKLTWRREDHFIIWSHSE